ncbi:hypothetical protein C7N43_06035 [Sphingobacteriales bacterium UPWRP_1]|nr:hypothetical protein C7N43_06035 [Sphingobacteriales bacterium UPWRP_1]
MLLPCLLVLVAGLPGCGKEEINFGFVPQITFVGLTPLEVQEYTGIVTITIAYEDGNGDIGEPDPDMPVVFVKDSRLQQPDGYHVQPVAPLGSGQVIVSGQLQVPIKNLFVLGNTQQEQVRFEVYITDRAGNQSNTIETPAVTVFR